MKLISVLRGVSVVAALASSSLATATTQSFSFTECLSGCSGSVASVANLTITSVGSGLVFKLSNTGPDGSFIGDFFTTGASGIALNFAGQSIANYTYSPSFHPNVVTSGNGYNYDFSYPKAANKDRFWSGDTATWEMKGENLSFDSFVAPLKMMVHVQGLVDGGSEKIGALRSVTAVPEPETYAMLLAGLGIIGGLARRRKQT